VFETPTLGSKDKRLVVITIHTKYVKNLPLFMSSSAFSRSKLLKAWDTLLMGGAASKNLGLEHSVTSLTFSILFFHDALELSCPAVSSLNIGKPF